MSDKIEAGCNISNPVMAVRHSDLEKLRPDESPFKVWCPVCKHGLLLVTRKQGTFRIARADRCTTCGQVFWYLDDEIGGEPIPESVKMPRIDPAKCIFDGSQF